jgi:CheY-like chemotaxis protein
MATPRMASNAKPPDILVVDDDEPVATTTARLLRLQGCTVRTAPSAERGLHEADAAHPDAIIVDYQMPIMDGLELLRKLRVHPRLHSTPVAIVTGGHLRDDVSAEIRSLGAEIWFKPLWLEDLVRLMRRLLEAKEPN